MSSNWDTHGNDSHSSDFNDGGDILLANANFKFEDRHGTTRSTPEPVLLLFQKLEAQDGDHDNEPRSKRKRSEEDVTPRDFGHDVASMKATTVPVVELPPKKRRKSGRKFEIFEGESLSMFMREVVELQGAISFATANLYSEPRRGSLQPIKAGSLTAYPNATPELVERPGPSIRLGQADQTFLRGRSGFAIDASDLNSYHQGSSKISSLLDSDSSSLELSMAAALTGEMEERASQMHIPEFIWVYSAVTAANTFQAEPIQRHHPPSVFPWVKISMAWVDIKDFTSKTFTGVANGDA
ncbi:hypothetical protein EDD22DRAFT_851371 [Suillus occidentalis]|nr:hypothetical protein EDD22DRAFT_851371 [Suillus occidentalis]